MNTAPRVLHLDDDLLGRHTRANRYASGCVHVGNCLRSVNQKIEEYLAKPSLISKDGWHSGVLTSDLGLGPELGGRDGERSLDGFLDVNGRGFGRAITSEASQISSNDSHALNAVSDVF